MQLSISGIPPECAAFARPTALQCYIDVIYYTSMQYMIYVCIYLIGLSGIRNGAAWQPVVDAAVRTRI